ncbi:hypothetical protein FACS189434_10810 [Bacteroidia bacterium]|nr:hypothetical protein FACS189434_10810 [Bacteroidia bacterium]
MKKVIFYIVLLGLVFGFGFVGGCYFRPQTAETVKYVPLPTVRTVLPKDSLRVVAERLPERVEVPERVRNASTSLSDRALRDTLYIMQSIDTLALIRDYILARDYRLTVIDNDTVGKCIVFATVQYNEITQFSAEFTPVQRVVTASTAGRISTSLNDRISTSLNDRISTWFDFAHQPSLTNRRIEPFLSLGYLGFAGGSTSLTDRTSLSNRSGLMLGGGCFYRHIGVEYQYVIKKNGHYFGLKYKF